MTAPSAARSVLRAGERSGQSPQDHVTLDYEARFLRRKVLHSDHGTAFLVDLAETRGYSS